MGPPIKTRSTPFSYTCRACNKCCYHKQIQINPFELLEISKALALTTTQILALYLVEQKPYLRQNSDGSCVFLGANGCQIHAHRPAVCRIYPLGRMESDTGQEYFVDAVPAIGSKGISGTNSTIETYVIDQRVDAYFAAGEKCLALQHRIVNRLTSGSSISTPSGFGENVLDWIDVDKIIGTANLKTRPLSIDEKLDAYIAILDNWLKSESKISKGDYNDTGQKPPRLA